MNLTEHFDLDEMTHSQTAIRLGVDNTPDAHTVENLRQLCENVLEPLRDMIGKPVHIDSGYRCVELNKAIGGVSSSQHCEGKAADIVVQGMSVDDVVALARTLPYFDQLIHEFGAWTHISYQPFVANRKEVLRAVKINGETQYLDFPSA